MDVTFVYATLWPPSASFASTSLAVLSFHAGLTPSDHSPRGTSTETLFLDPSQERAPA